MLSRKLQLLFILIVFQYTGYTQALYSAAFAKSVLTKTLESLSALHAVSYDCNRETRYYDDNYTDNRSFNFYMEKDAGNDLGIRFKAALPTKTYIFNGKEEIVLEEDKKLRETSTIKNSSELYNNSYLFHSMFMLQKMLTLVIRKDSFIRGIQDTMINGTVFYQISIEAKNAYFGIVTAMVEPILDQNLVFGRPYILIIDKKTFLPYQFISKYSRPGNDKDYIKITYSSIKKNPKLLQEEYWQNKFYSKSYAIKKKEQEKVTIKEGAKLPGFILPYYLPGKSGKLHSTSFSGKITLLDFWFKSCGPCMESMPHLNDLHQMFAKEKFQLLSVNVEDGVSDLKFFYKKLQPTYPMLYNGKKYFYQQLGFDGCPTAILIDAKGTILHIWEGFNQQDMEAKISEAVKVL